MLPDGEEIAAGPSSTSVTVEPSKSIKVEGTGTAMERRAEFKRRVSDLAAKLIEAYRKRFFSSNNEYVHFIRKVSLFQIIKPIPKSLHLYSDNTHGARQPGQSG